MKVNMATTITIAISINKTFSISFLSLPRCLLLSKFLPLENQISRKRENQIKKEINNNER